MEEIPKRTKDQAFLLRHYTQDYKRDLDDSPEETRRDLNRQIMATLREGKVHPQRILDIGSGPQLLERMLLQSYKHSDDPKLLKATQFVTMDFADIQADRLKGQKHSNVSHVRADGSILPFKSESFGMVVSNMAIDLMPRATFSEVAQVLADQGIFVLTLHHPDLMKTLINETNDENVKAFIRNGFEQGMFFNSEEEIRDTLIAHGLQAEEIATHRGSPRRNDKWWFVKGFKS